MHCFQFVSGGYILSNFEIRRAVIAYLMRITINACAVLWNRGKAREFKGYPQLIAQSTACDITSHLEIGLSVCGSLVMETTIVVEIVARLQCNLGKFCH